jgi:hypothetical protein
MSDKTLQPGYFAQLNERTKLIEIVEMKTGAIVAVQRDSQNLLEKMPDALVEHVLPDGSRIMLQRGIDPGAVAHVRNYPFSQYTVDLLCEKIAKGGYITKLLGSDIFPPHAQFARWKREHPYILSQLEEAKKDRAEFMRDKALQEADAAQESEIGAHKLRVETFKWAAGVDDQTKYSPRAKVDAVSVQPIQIVISTGIDRSPLSNNTIREVKDANTSINEDITSLPDSARSTASSSGAD